ncbi:hypothetical protein BSKO_08740 [Bryopsis sp. KO-2023]|nr:hypothetical protein BSKO_08740 [Bryopsis sp. KO-2023]
MAARSRVDLQSALLQQFERAVGNKSTMGFREFMEVTKCRSKFFAERLFQAVDVDNSGDISFDEFVDTMHILQTRDSKRRIRFIFKLFDQDGDGVIQFSELKQVLRASVEESDASLPAAEVDDLAAKLREVFEQANKDLDGEASAGDEDGISLEAFEAVLEKYPDVLEGLSLEGVTLGRGERGPGKRKKQNAIKRVMNWVTQNPQLAFTYTTYSLVVLALFFWRFSRYAHNCDGAPMDVKDPVSNLTRQEVMDIANDWKRNRTESKPPLFTVADMKYMAFSSSQSKLDPIGCQDSRKRKLLSWTLPVAKGAGQAMKGTFTLILFPVSRNLMTTLRNTFLKHIFNFDEAIEFHRYLGKVGFFFAWLHTLCHVVDVIRWQQTGRFERWSWAFPDDDQSDPLEEAVTKIEVPGAPPRFEFDMEQQPDRFDGIPFYLFRDTSSQPTAGELLGAWYGVTGICLICLYTIAAMFALDYPKKLAIFDETPSDKRGAGGRRKMILAIGRTLRNFNMFWYTHHLFALFYICMLLHPLPHIPNERREWGWSDSWLWVGIPVLIYLTERIIRFARTASNTRVVAADLFPGNVTGLKVRKPKSVVYQAGMYAFINIPELSYFEWHPFTLTSSPGDNYFSFHIRVAGDWTRALHKMVKKYHEDKGAANIQDGMVANTRRNITRLQVKGVAGPPQIVQERFPFSVYVDGPFGAPAQNHKDYNVMILVGAGIGVTPFASVLNDILDTMKKNRCPNCQHSLGTSNVKKVYFYWTLRLRNEAVWFKHLLEEIATEDTAGILDINIHVTSIRKANDVRVALLRLAHEQVAQNEGVDAISTIKTRAITKFGRPNWDEAFTRAKTEHPDERDIGVFYCGPNGLAKVLNAQCKKHSNSKVKYDFMKESFG